MFLLGRYGVAILPNSLKNENLFPNNNKIVNKEIGILIPSLKKGGAEKQAVLLAKALNDDYSVTLIVVNAQSGFEAELVKLSGLKPDRIICLNSHKKRRLYQILRIRHIDTLFCYLTWPDFLGAIIGRLAGVKTIYQGLRNAALPTWKLYLEVIGNKFATGAITNNYIGAEIFEKKGIKNQIVIPNCYLNPMPNKQRLEREYITAITVGRFVEQKDYPTAIFAMAKAMARNPKLRFKIIGHGELEDEVRKLVKEHCIDDRTEILINPPGIINHLLDADIYLSTSLFEGTSNSIMEAMDASLPIVATNVGDNNRLVFPDENGYLTEIHDIDKIAEYIVKLSMSLELRNNFGMNSNKILSKDYSFKSFKQHYTDLLG